jgi:hypothetical protein
MSASRLLTAACVIAFATTCQAGVILEDRPAPEWAVSEWINGDPGRLEDHLGRVVLIEFFQLWCPVSNSFAIPLFRRWDELYGDRDDVLIVSIHSVFEGQDVQTPERLRQFVHDRGIRHPVGIDAFTRQDPLTPITMSRFGAEGTPQVVIVDKNGKVRFSHFGVFRPEVVESFIDRLLKERGPQPARPKP